MSQKFIIQEKFQQYCPCLMLGTYWVYVSLYVRMCMHIIYSELNWYCANAVTFTSQKIGMIVLCTRKFLFITMNLLGMVITFKMTSLYPYQLFCYIFIHLSHFYIDDFHLCCKFVSTGILCNHLKK